MFYYARVKSLYLKNTFYQRKISSHVCRDCIGIDSDRPAVTVTTAIGCFRFGLKNNNFGQSSGRLPRHINGKRYTTNV